MSTELLINFDKSTQKTTSTSNTTINKNDSNEKKEGMSLFDSLMNEAKSDEPATEEKSDKQKVEEKSDKQKVEEKSDKQKVEERFINKEKSNSIDGEIKADDKKNSTVSEQNNTKKINTDTGNEVSEKKDISLKKLVDKLVDIVVSAAKDIFDKKDKKNIETSEVKNTVEKILNKTIETVEDKKALKEIVSKKLDIVKNSVGKIKNEVDENNLDIPSPLDEKTKKQIDNSKETIKDEVKIIKENVKKIHTDINVLKDNKSTETTDSQNSKIKNNVENSLNIIDESSDEIEDIISKINGTSKKENILKDESPEIIDKKKNNSELKKESEVFLHKETKLQDDLSKTTSKIEHKIEVIKEAISNINEKVSEVIIVKTTGEDFKKKEIVSSTKNIINSESSTKDAEKPLIASMFLNAQKTTKNQTSLEQIKDAKSNINDKKTIEAVKVSAEKLDLNVEDAEVTQENEEGKKPISPEKKEELKTNNLINNKALNRVLIDQKIEANNQNRERNTVLIQKEQSTIVDNEKKHTESIEMNVPKEIIPSLQNKIIGAQQKMGSFMSEVARNMYLNYKPPVTAFRVNLNPANLGSVSIIMKANKVDNSLTVSMNLSNSNTMEAFTENKVALQNAIQRQFNETSNVSINFNLEGQSSENQFGQNSENNQKNQNNNSNNSDNEVEDIEENEIIATNDYM